MINNNISWIKKSEELNLESKKTPNRLDNSVYFRGHTVKQLDFQKKKFPTVDISDSIFNTIPNVGPGASLPFNKARIKVFGSRIENVKNIVGKRRNIDHI